MTKVRCTLRVDCQRAYVAYDLERIYAPVASKKTIRLLFSMAAANKLILDGSDVSNAYLHGKLDLLI